MASTLYRPRPIVKWAGGKTQLLPILRTYYGPLLEAGTIQRYVEPFMGSGAVLWDMLSRCPTLESVAIDQNARLIAVYRVVQTAVDALIAELSDLQARYWAASHEARTTMYYAVRTAFNHHEGTAIHQAAQFIFLNHTCFNGLYRVNRRAEFNVPMGRYRQPTICDPHTLQQAHLALQRVTLLAGDYHQAAHYGGHRLSCIWTHRIGRCLRRHPLRPTTPGPLAMTISGN